MKGAVRFSRGALRFSRRALRFVKKGSWVLKKGSWVLRRALRFQKGFCTLHKLPRDLWTVGDAHAGWRITFAKHPGTTHYMASKVSTVYIIYVR